MNNRKKSKFHAVLLETRSYEIYSNKVTLRAGRVFRPFDSDRCYISSRNDNLVIEHFFGYGQHEVFEPGTYKIVTK